MSAQTSYSINQQVALAGLVYAQAPSDIISRSCETVAGIPFGVAVSTGTDPDKECILGGATGFLGISIRSLEREGVQGSGVIQYDEKETVGIIRNGYVWATCPSGCNPGDKVNFVEATGVLDSGAASGTGETELDDAQWDSVAAAGELGIIRINSTSTTAGT